MRLAEFSLNAGSRSCRCTMSSLSGSESMKLRLLAIVLVLGSFAIGQDSQNSSPAAGEPAAKVPAVQPKIDPAKEADIRKLMQLTGADALAAQMMGNMETTLRPSLINAFPPGDYRTRLVDLFFERLSSKIGASMADLTIPIYDKYFSDEEIQQLTAFYQTQVGDKAIKVLPQLMNEVMTTSQAWGQQLAQECMKEVLAEHPDLKQAMEQAEKSRKPQ